MILIENFMPHISEIHLQNFQPHADKRIPMSDITVLAGKSDVGKSAVVRALRWLCLNTGSPATYIQRGKSDVGVTAKMCGVSIDTPPYLITRQNSNKKNGYVLDGKEFNAIGKDIPPEVKAVLNVISDNFQTQHDYLYWFTESGSGLVKRIETAFGLSETAEWTASAKQEIVRLEKDVKEVDGRIDKLNKEIESLSVFRELHEVYLQYEAGIGKVLEEKEKLKRIDVLLRKIPVYSPLPDDAPLVQAEACIKERERLNRLTSLVSQYPQPLPQVDVVCLDHATAHVAAKEKLRRVQALVQAFPAIVPVADPTACFQTADYCFAERQKLARISYLLQTWNASIVPQVDAMPILQKMDELQLSKEKMNRLRQLCEFYNQATVQRDFAYTEYQKTEQQLATLVGQPCPTCGKPL